MIRKYFQNVEDLLSSCPLAIYFQFDLTVVDHDRGFWKATLILREGYELHLFEYVLVEDDSPDVQDYRYHYQDPGDELIFRFDNAPHHSELESHPHHLHTADGINSTSKPDLERVLDKAIKEAPR